MSSIHEMMRAIRRQVRAAIAERAAREKPAQPPRVARVRRIMRTHPDDEFIARQLSEWHGRLNAERFGGLLATINVRVSRRMRSRLGHYAPAQRGAPPEIAISSSHVKRHGFEQAVHTLLHEMVHQWQDEAKLPLGHGPDFRAKARQVGIVARAARAVD
ncbi:MAG: SprT-like domain-containing protein [Gemmatimonadales bacterium]